MLGVSIVKDFFREGISFDTAMSQVTSYALSDMFYLPPGTIPPMVMPFDPTASVPLCLVSVSSPTMSAQAKRRASPPRATDLHLLTVPDESRMRSPGGHKPRRTWKPSRRMEPGPPGPVRPTFSPAKATPDLPSRPRPE